VGYSFIPFGTSKDVVSALILGGDFFTGSVLASALTKLVLRFDDLTTDRPKANALRAEVRTAVDVSIAFIDAHPGNVDNDIYYPGWPVEVCHGTDRRGF
jgi:hypothetical protein